MPIPEPAVSRKTLMTTAALIWAAAGILLCFRGASWLRADYPVHGHWSQVAAFVGIGLGILKGHFIFSRLARRNITRIKALSPHKDKICVFAFQAYESYLIVAIMITLGILLRLSPIPRLYLAGIYLLIGTALLIGSISYLRATD